ncbi:MAG: hypothetical protein ACRC0L_12155 [Angustibacter sp.]
MSTTTTTAGGAMQIHRCRCGQPLAVVADGVARLGLPIAAAAVDRQVRAALERHVATLPDDGTVESDEHEVVEPMAHVVTIQAGRS